MKDTKTSKGWVKVISPDGQKSEYSPLTGRIRYDCNDNLNVERPLTAKEIEQLILDESNNPYSPMPTPIGKGFGKPEIICSDCKGTGEYKGWAVVEDCQKCGGKGTCSIH